MNFKNEIIKIVELQEIDSSIYSLKLEKEEKFPAELENIRREFENKKQSLVSCEEKLKQIQLKKKEKEIDLASKEESLLKIQGQLYQLKTNKEYQAKLTEISSMKADISIIEDGLIQILDEVEKEKNEFDEERKRLDEEGKKSKEIEERIEAQIKENELKIIQFENKRNVLSKDIDKTIIAKYEKLLKTRQGLAIVPVKNNSCGACYLSLTPQKINEIKMFENLILCESCVRILYIPEDIS